MKNNKANTGIIVAIIVMLGLIFMVLIIVIGYMNSPTNFGVTLDVNMDNNTLQAVKSINWSRIPQ